MSKDGSASAVPFSQEDDQVTGKSKDPTTSERAREIKAEKEESMLKKSNFALARYLDSSKEESVAPLSNSNRNNPAEANADVHDE